jgi:hypothetical protein
MDYQKYFLDIIDFISPYEDIVLNEPLNQFEKRKHYYPQYLIDQLREMKDAEHYRFIHFHETKNLDQRAVAFQDKINCLTSPFPYKKRQTDQLPSWALWRVSKKKQHEIEQIIGFIKEQKGIQKIVDIGGGIGHLARTLAHYYQKEVLSIDQNLEFQELGKKRASKYPLPNSANSLTFLNKDFKRSVLKELHYDLSIGLHTCGELAVEHLHVMEKPLVNFGCCYHRLDENSFPLSTFCRDNLPFKFTKEAFTLATRSHYGADEKQFYKTKKVKDFRFTLQLLLKEDYEIDHFFSVGSSVNSTYKSSFADYAIERLEHLNYEVKRESNELNQFFVCAENQKKIREIYLCNVIRWRFGRLLELIIILDRVLWLQEQGVKARIEALFDPVISPRNLAVIV